MSRPCEGLARRRGALVLAVAILLAAAAARLWALGEIPPGLGHDEVAHWLITQEIRAGHHAIYFTAAYGHEPLFEYLLTASVALLGDHWLGLRFVTVALGLLGLAVTTSLLRRLFGPRVALMSAAMLALAFWPLSFARVALRAISLPLFAALALTAIVRALDLPARQARTPIVQRWSVMWPVAGALIGLGIYSYMAARILPLIVACLLVYLLMVYPPARRAWPGMLMMGAVAAAVAAPLAVWLLLHPGAEYRVSEVSQPLNRLLAGDPALAWANLVANLGSFTVRGDPWPRYNIPGRPIFGDVISAALFYAGVLIAVWRWRDPRYGLLLIWQLGALGPSVASADAPSAIRGILGLVVAFAFPALALDALLRVGERWLGRLRPGRRWARPATAWALVLLGLGPLCYLSLRDYFVVWPQQQVVRFDYQSDLFAAARQLDALPADAAVAVAGLSVDTMDGPSLTLGARRDTHSVRLFDARETLLVPAGSVGWLLVPHVVPFDRALRERLLAWGATAEASDPHAPAGFTAYHLADRSGLARGLASLATGARLPDGAQVALPASFGGQLAYLGCEHFRQSDPTTEVVLTYWRVEQVAVEPLKVFAHLLGADDVPVAQDDGLGSVPAGWSVGDLLVQRHDFNLAGLPAGEYTLQVGVYARDTGARLRVGASDRLLLYGLEIAQ